MRIFQKQKKTHLSDEWSVKLEVELQSDRQSCRHIILVSENLAFHDQLIVPSPDCPWEKYGSFRGVLKAMWRAEGTARCP